MSSSKKKYQDNRISLKAGILIPTYNRREYFTTAFMSALGQTYENIEIIVIDNGSTDGTAEYMQGVSDPRVRYVVNERNLGLIGSINKGTGLFTDGVEWCTILCDDDVFDADCVRKLVHAVEEWTARTIIHPHKILIDTRGARTREALPSPAEESGFAYMLNRSRYKRETFLSGIFFKRKAFDEIGGYPQFTTGLASDDAFIFALSLRDRLLFEPNATVYIRLHADAESMRYANIAPHLRALGEFGVYCEGILQTSGKLNDSQKRTLSSAIGRYITLKKSALLIKNLLFLSGAPRETYQQRLVETYRTSRGDAAFLPGAQFIVWCAYASGYLPGFLNTQRFMNAFLKALFYLRRIVSRP